MGQRSYVPFDVFAMRVEVPVSTAVRDGDLGWTCGQCPLTDKGDVYAPDDMLAQTGFVCDMIEKVMARAGFSRTAIGRLHVYFAANSERQAHDAKELIAARFDHGPIIVPIPVPHFYYDGMLIEVDVFAAADLQVRAPCMADGVRLNLVDTGDQVWVHAVLPLDDNPSSADPAGLMADALARQGLESNRLLSDLWMVSGGAGETRGVADSAQRHRLMTNPVALVQLADPAPPLVAASLTFGRQPVSILTDENTETGLRLTLKTSGQMFWAAGTCADPGLDLVGQTTAIMQAIDTSLRNAGMNFAKVVKLTAHYTGGASEEELHGNMKVRHGYYASPGPASTGLPVAALGNDGCRIAIEVVAI